MLIKKSINTIIILFMLLSNIVIAQKQGNIWLFGEGAGLNFNSGNPIPISGGQVYGMPTQVGDYPYDEGCTSISDSSGNLLFYSNGMRVWNKFHQIMPNGDSLKGFTSSSSAAFAIPKPTSDSLFYLFTTDGIERKLGNGLRYSIINMCLDNGKGDVKKSQKNILLLDTVSEKLCAITHPNGTDVWLIAHKYHSSLFYAYLITPSGINAPIITNIGSIHSATSFSTFGAAIGQMKASSNGSLIGLVYSNVTPSAIELFNFNPTSGVLSNSISLTPAFNECGIEFSPNNSKLYVSSLQGIHQFDLSVFNQTAINATKVQISTAGASPSYLQLANNNKIYCTRGNNKLSVINNPNSLGSACNFSLDAISVGTATRCTSLPLYFAGYTYKNKLVGCPVSETTINEFEFSDFSVYPNPSSGQITIKQFDNTQTADKIEIYNTVGQLVFSKQIHSMTETINLELSKGLYFYSIKYFAGRRFRNKLIIE